MTTTTIIEIPRPSSDSQLHLYVAWGCPFCHKVMAALELTGLDKQLSYTWMHNIKGPAGWEIAPGVEPLFGETSLRGIYERLAPGGTHTHAVPLLVNLTSGTLLSTSSPQMTRFFSKGMNGAYPVESDLIPDGLEKRIDRMNAWLHERVNRAVYRVGFATTQANYISQVIQLFESLDRVEDRLAAQPYLFGDSVTESDLYLFATLVRFDSVYHPLFKCSYRRIVDYPALSNYIERLQLIDGMSNTYSHSLIKEHYYLSAMHVGGEVRELNPSRLIPVDSCNPGQKLKASDQKRIQA